MTSIDEAIERELNIAHKGSDCWKHCSNTKKHCKDCMAEHRQNADWLKELKELRKIKEDYAKEMQTSYATFMYNKAIDDFKSRLEERILAGKMIDEKFAYIDNCDIDEIAEQLKAGGENGT